MEFKYAVKPKEMQVKAMGRDMNVSFKDMVVLASAIRGKKLGKAIELMNDVIALKKPVPYRRFNNGVGHRRGDNAKVGKYPKKAAKHVLAVLMNLQANAEFRGYDAERIMLTHVQAQRGVSRLRRKPKGRWTVWNTEYCHMQMIGEER
jgi:large subunit ribosomal protein L22